MNYRKLGATDIDVSVVAMGCWAIAGDWVWGQQDENEAISTLRAALDAGVNFFDTAEAYGDGYSETLLGKALAGRRHEAVIATKVSDAHLAADALRQACERSLRRLNTDYIDLYQIHWPNWSIPLAETMGALESLKQQGKIRAMGVCNFGPVDLSGLLDLGRCETNQLPYSLLWRAVEFEIGQRCIEHGIGVLCYSPLAQGLLTGKFASADDVPETRARTRHFSKSRRLTRHGEDGCEEEVFVAIAAIRAICEGLGAPMAEVALAWLLRQPGVTAVLAGARTPGQLRENVRAAARELSPDTVDALSQATEALKRRLGPNLDPYQAVSRMR